VTAGADDISAREKAWLLIPDMYANAGGVTVSYFEWVKKPEPHPLGRCNAATRKSRHQWLVESWKRLSADSGVGWQFLSPNLGTSTCEGAGELDAGPLLVWMTQ